MIAIHTKTGSFAAGWIEYCQKNDISFKEVDCFADDIIHQLQGCDALLWHWEHHDYRAVLFARQLIASVEAMGLIVFPTTSTGWHYDDKVGQKYLLEAIGAPLIPSHVFYEKDKALEWLTRAPLPLVWKLRGGAGSQNVRLIHSRKEARRIIHRSFGKGWRPVRLHALRERLWQFRRHPGLRNFIDIGRGLVRIVVPHEKHRNQPAERNYVYFQEFAPENDHDIRVVVIGGKAFAIKRMVRGGDFRASGSGVLIYEHSAIPDECIRTAFDVTSRIGSQSCTFDFVHDGNDWKIVEISYAFSPKAYWDCPGYWDADLGWHPGPVRPEYFMIEDVLSRLPSKERRDG